MYEEELRRIYLPYFVQHFGMSKGEAEKTFREYYAQCKQEMQQQGMDNLPIQFGDKLLENLDAYPNFKSAIEVAIKDGAMSEDIRAWWNMSEIERRFVIKLDNQNRLAAFMQNLQDGLSKEEAAQRVKQFYVVYGYPLLEDNDTNRPIPPELKDRVNIYLSNLASNGKVYSFRERLTISESMNAVVRKEIVAGNI